MTDHSTALYRTLRQVVSRSNDPTTDRELLRRFAEHRDETAFTALVQRYAPMVLGVGLRTLHHRQDAEDVCQATFLTLSQKAATVAWGESVAGWLYDVAHRHAQNVRSAAHRRAVHESRFPTGPHPDAATEATLHELQAVLDEELGRLAEKYRTPLVLCCLEGMTRDEAAQFLGLSLSAVKNRLEEGRERLRRGLARRGVPLATVFAGYTLLSAEVRAATSTLVRTITRAAVGGAAPAPAPGALLVTRAGPKVSSNALGVLGGVLLVAGVLVAGLVERTPADVPAPPGEPKEPTETQRRLDRFGDPLPDGAVLRLGTVRLRHVSIYSLAFTSDGHLASFGRDYVVKVWDPATGKLLREGTFPRERVHRFWGGRLSPDGRLLAVQLGDRMKVFDVGSTKELSSVKLASSWEAWAGFSPDGKVLAVIDQDDKQTAERLLLCDVGSDDVRELAKLDGISSEPVFSRDGKRLAAPEGCAGVRVWDLASGRELLRFRPRGLLGGTVDFDPTGEVLVVLGATNPPQRIHLGRVSTGKAPDDWTAPKVSDFEWVKFAPTGTALLLGGRKGLLCWDLKTGKKLFGADGAAEVPAAFSPDGKLVASARPGSIRLWDLASGRSAVPRELSSAPEEELHGAAVSPDGKWVLTKGADTGAIRVWDPDGRPKGTIPSNRWGGRYPLFSPDGRSLFGAAPDAIALVRWDFPGGKEVARYTFAEPAADQVYIYHFGLSADGTRLAAVTQTINRPGPVGAGGPQNQVATLTVWETGTGKRLESREVSSEGHMGYGAFAPDLRWYFTGNRALALAGGADFAPEVPAGWVSTRQTAVSPDGRLVARLIDMWVNDDFLSRVVVSETATGKPVLTLPTGYCGPIAFTPDARALVVTDVTDVTRWDLATRTAVVRYKSPGRFSGSYGGAFASSLVVTRDGTRAVTGQADTTALVWDLRPSARKIVKLTEPDLASAWADLSGADAEKGCAAVWALIDAGPGAVSFLAPRLEPVSAPTDERVRKLIAQLGAEGRADRDAAERELRELGETVAPALRAALKGARSAEQLRRLNVLLAGADDPLLGPGSQLRTVRAVAVLEGVATKDARALLGRLARGAPGARLTREAAAALQRLGD
jgi:RNA polymerase sigma factor (sigma-70 family)